MTKPAPKFPATRYETAELYVQGYRDNIAAAWATVDPAALAAAARMLKACFEADRLLYACGNGGSAAIANHLLCDFHKGIQTGTTLRPRVVSLSAHLELITAIANDIAYEECFAYQLRTMARPGDVLMTVSSSGNSENIVRAAQWAKANGVGTIALTGFAGGRSSAIADVVVHVGASNYGVVEDVHQSVMHMLAQYLRQALMPADAIAKSPF